MDIYRPEESAELHRRSAAAESGRHIAQHPAPSESAHRLGSLVGELKEYASYFLSAKADSAKASVVKFGLYAALGIVGLVAAGAILVTAVVLLLVGAAGGIGAALGGNAWLGSLIIGAFVLLCIGLGAYLAVARVLRSRRRKTVNKYEQRQSWQRGRFGRDVEQAAAAKRQ